LNQPTIDLTLLPLLPLFLLFLILPLTLLVIFFQICLLLLQQTCFHKIF
jgi:hypothetical protein